MSQNDNVYSILQCATDINTAIAGIGADTKKLGAGLAGPMQKLMQRGDLLEIGLPRQGNNVAFSRYLYFDADMTMIVFKVPMDKAVQPHDHGIWESLFVYRGQLRHTKYQRTDAGDRDGFADLRVVDDGVLSPGDFTVVAPPEDIHGFVALTDDTYGISVVKGEYKEIRNYYNPQSNEVVQRKQVTSR